MSSYPYPIDVNGLYSFADPVVDDALTCAGLVQQAYFEYYNLNDVTPLFGYPGWSDLVTMPPSGYTLLYNIYYNGEEILDLSAVPYFGFVAQGPGSEVYFVLRGTETITEWYDDIILSNQVGASKIIPGISTISSTALLHKGFSDIYSNLAYYAPPTTGNPAAQSGSAVTLADVLSGLSADTN